ncbi:LysR family transcriptional regulator [Pseudoxanthomonas sp. JBR18]|uniref:LysR family transcriptional regulator n=1 Tax=Pseudoxanthomonas sp. JBR18 TaxID=2969308 RepID=UPI0023061FDB|nr:LysR family transcriptional regulator [Pseudoxanthomonas sp. JBR18]WCE03402.1 LysR family transcriptional regulator [Pseudoxanthomonas sp. JBR18]
MDSLDTLRIFQRVAELGGFTRAADSLGLPKASVSTAVARLEASLGTQLLHRTTRRVQLTADGEVFYQRSRDLADDMDELHGMFRQARQLKGRLRVDMSGGVACGYVLPRLPEFLAEHPLLEVEISSTDRLVDVVREGFDCVLRAGTVADSSLVARPLGMMPVVTCASPAYLARHGTPHTADELEGHQLVHYVGTLGQRSPGLEYFDGSAYVTRALPGPITVNSGDAYVAAALAGFGIIQPPAMGVRQLLASGELVEILPDAPAEPMPLTLLYPQRRHLPRRVAAFMDWLAGVATPHLDPMPVPR